MKKLLGLLVVCGSVAVCFGQGSLTPPGAPGPTMRTLDQVEPRQLLTNAPATIGQPGSYYLANNLSGTVTIAASDVSLDLMGFAIRAPSGDGIKINASRTNLLVRNGIVSAALGNGLDFSLSMAGANGVIEDLRVSGCAFEGIAVGSGFTVRRCQVSGVAYAGIRVTGNAEVLENTVTRCGTGLGFIGEGARAAGNIVKGNTDNYDFASGNQLHLMVSEIPERLDWPCSVKLAGTLLCPTTGVHGLTVNADDVTIDMDGHTLVGPGEGSGSGIYQSDDRRNLTVRNGKAIHWRGVGQAGFFTEGSGNRLSDLQATTNRYGLYAGFGCLLSDCAAQGNIGIGIFVESGNTISGCSAQSNTQVGILALYENTISGCAARYNGSDGIAVGHGNTLSRCTVKGNLHSGIGADSWNTLSECSATRNGASGIQASFGNILSDCAAGGNLAEGIRLGTANRAVGNICIDNASGIRATGSDNRIDGNSCKSGNYGVRVEYVGNFIARNTCSGGVTNWSVVAGNVCLVVNAATAGAISGNAGGTAPGSTDPNANFTY
jgi:hypothetical protein